MIRRLFLWYISLTHIVHLAAIIAYMAVIFVLSSMPINLDVQLPIPTAMFFNLCHVPLYFGLSVLIALYMRKIFEAGVFGRKAAGEERGFSLAGGLLAIGALLVYALSDEFHQSFTGHNPSLLDLGSDLIGGLLGVLFLGYLIDRKPKLAPFLVFAGGLAAAAVTVAYFGSVQG